MRVRVRVRVWCWGKSEFLHKTDGDKESKWRPEVADDLWINCGSGSHLRDYLDTPLCRIYKHLCTATHTLRCKSYWVLNAFLNTSRKSGNHCSFKGKPSFESGLTGVFCSFKGKRSLNLGPIETFFPKASGLFNLGPLQSTSTLSKIRFDIKWFCKWKESKVFGIFLRHQRKNITFAFVFVVILLCEPKGIIMEWNQSV